MKNKFIPAALILASIGGLLAAAPSACGAEDTAGDKNYLSFDRRDTTFYATVFKDEIYNKSFALLEPLRLWRFLTLGKPAALDVNRFDEVIEGSFFTHRHGRSPLGMEALKAAPLKTPDPGPSQKGRWKILKGKTDGVTPGFFIEDTNGDKFLLKFDPRSNPEMTTSAEIIGHKFFYALGYHVPSYSLVDFSPDILEVDPGATYYNKQGFKHKLTREKALEMLRRDAPLFAGRKYRASCSRIIAGRLAGYFEYDENDLKESGDLIPHDRLRVFRALRVFGSWINNYDLHRKNTMTSVTDEAGHQTIRHYFIDFGSSFGSAAYRPKVPAVGFENLIDFKEAAKAAATLKVAPKPWEKRWDKNEQVITHTNLGYFDNREFRPDQWKSNMPHFAFDYLRPEDAYWAAKIISRFTDEEIRELVKTGGISDKRAEKLLADALIERRDIIARYWFEKVSPLEKFSLEKTPSGLRLRFEDLSVKKGWVTDRLYVAKIYSFENGKWRRVQKSSHDKCDFLLPPLPGEKGGLLLCAVHKGKKRPFATVIFENKEPYKILRIKH